MIRRVSAVLSFLVVLGLVPLAAEAQQLGTITGRVTSAGGQPLAETRIQIVGSTRGTMTGADGSYRITLVPAGSHQLRAIRLGYAASTRAVTVRANESVEANFSLSETATTLDQVVVTATGETQRRRESGASVGTIDTSSFNAAAAPTLSNILSSRTPGLTIQGSSGTTGTSSRTRIRGANSINLSNDPLIIVDGIRVNNASGGTGATGTFSIGIGGQSINRLDDFNPEDIESIDVIKGPAAAALYGTAAANGVIQITTKKGRAGRTRWQGNTEYGTLSENSTFPANFAQVGTSSTGAATTTCTLERQVLRTCTAKPDSLLQWNPLMDASPFITGWRQSHGLNVNGGNEQTTYYVAGEFEREQGIYDVNRLRRISGRSNIRMQLRNDLDATLSLGVLRYKLQLPFNDNSSFGPIGAGLLGKAFDCSPTTYRANLYCGTDSLGRGYLNGNAPPSNLFNIDNNQQNDRLTSSIQANWTPRSWLRGTGQLGADILNRLDEQLVPANKVFLSASLQEGSRFQDRRRIPTYNAGTSFTATYDVPGAAVLEGVTGATTLGTQFVREEIHGTSATGSVLTPGTNSLNGASARFGVGEINQEIVTLGFIGQQQFTYKDRLFLTASVRTDRNSSFGTNFKWVAYPAASLSWVVSEEGFFPQTEFIDQLRLRTAVGSSGQRPVFRDAATFFNPVAFRSGSVEIPAITVGPVGGTGNPDLKPEKTTEMEAGFEGSFFSQRLSLEFTGYKKSTKDAIIAQTLAPSLGVSTTRLTNVGEVENVGVEALGTVNILRMENVELSTTMTVSSNRNKLLEGGKGFVPVLMGFGNTQQHRVGYPLGGYFKPTIVSYNDFDGNGIISRVNCPTYSGVANPQLFGGPRCEVVLSDSSEYLGSSLPTREATFNTGLTVMKNIRLTTLFDYRGGYRIFNSTNEFRCTSFFNCQASYDKNVPLDEQARTVARLMGTEVGFIEDASFVKWREVALTLSAPREWAQRAKVDGLAITFAGRNLATWTDYRGVDPEVNANAVNLFSISDFLSQPPVRYFVTRLSLNF